ncbi:uncharacterized protein BO97DRAFT_230494 [Aspergillus homomorphus CBS 101889]|uniref:Uncharacterized protein n=1 Tax=Aspergillus homomorphus (strain CBS 101889) TaxID=1450537 RepID=A0A395HK56_ASPHC|nr:hypothetical protein BO97DRAFT_230494 [Aspergillus homomorphus CBS 101889]RAL07899.1 hypothetical protein BO97DRAFT_230494 [Aspergillus homomorphus CBS 101889]
MLQRRSAFLMPPCVPIPSSLTDECPGQGLAPQLIPLATAVRAQILRSSFLVAASRKCRARMATYDQSHSC